MKNKALTLMVLVLGLMLVSCGKDPNSEWTKYYGYTNDDIIGTYRFSNVSDAFASLTESDYCHLCSDAQITIASYSMNSVEFHVKSPNADYDQTFTGVPSHNTDDFLISMSNQMGSTTEYTVTATVYNNAKGEIRLHGFARKIIYGIDDEEHKYVKYCYNYYFDVIKN